MTVFETFLESSLPLLFGGLLAFVLVAWAFDKFLNVREEAQWRKARVDGKVPLKPEFARRGGSTGKMSPLDAVREANAKNGVRFNNHYKNYEDTRLETFAHRVRNVLPLLHPEFHDEWLAEHSANHLSDAAVLVAELGLEDVANKLRDLAPYQFALHSYAERDLDVPDDAPEAIRFREDAEWLEENRAWERVWSKANDILERDYPWEDT